MFDQKSNSYLIEEKREAAFSSSTWTNQHRDASNFSESTEASRCETSELLNNEKVKERSQDQRLALPGDPKCVICSRYGEYICDETDDDVCSLECKQTLLLKVEKSKSEPLPPPNKLPANDECYYINGRDNREVSESLTSDQASLLRKKLDIFVKGESVIPAPICSFSSSTLPKKLLQNIESAGYEMPTPVQMQTIPAALSRQNLLVSAETGTGKTASFLIPIISICANRPSIGAKKPLAIVLEPTRELCIQVEEEAKLLGKGLPFKTALVVGGDAMAGQMYRIKQGVEFIVGTPGRLIDLLTKHEHDIELDDVMFFVLDEVDCMLQRGFRDQVMQIFVALSQPQVLLFSATISQEVEKMSSTMAKNMTKITVGNVNAATKSVKQIPIWVETKNKKQKLFDILSSKQHFMPPVVIYVGSRIGADLLANAITITSGMKALSIHGEKSMKERREIMKLFLMGESQVIVATGLLDRGVNLLSVRQVIVFDMPSSVKEYVHQIGRASRLGEEGKAILFVNEEDKNLFPELVDVLKSSGAIVPRELLNSRWLVSVGKGQRKRKLAWNWIRNIEQHDSVNKILLGNKADMDESKQVVPTAKGQALADEYGNSFFETSANTNLNVVQVFFSIARDIKQRLADTDSKADPSTIRINQPDQAGGAADNAQKSACCG